MTDRPRLTEVDLWRNHELRVQAVLQDALLLLDRDPGDDEPALNRKLYMCVLQANRARQVRGQEAFDYPPEYEARNAPTPDTEGKPAENKIPDFAWRYLDPDVEDSRRSSRDYHVECKRLGATTPSGWDLNRNYVANGVNRFRDDEFRYGKDVATGAMVGYIESMTPDDVLDEVNAAARDLGFPEVDHVSTHSDRLLEHECLLTRRFPVSPFRISHLWVEFDV